MAADAIVDSELKSLQDEVSAAARKSTAEPPPAPPPEDGDLRGLLAELADEAVQFLKDAEKDVAAHPAASVGAALLAGIVIGLLLRRR